MRHPLDDLHALAEVDYIRSITQQLIQECLDQGNDAPLSDMIEDLVAKGSSSLLLLSGILDELRLARASIYHEMLALRQTLIGAMQDFGVEVPLLEGDWMAEQVNLMPSHLSGLSEEDRAFLLDIAAELGSQIHTKALRMAILWSLESFLQDWIHYEAAHEGEFSEDDQLLH